MAEIVLGTDDNVADVAQALLDLAGDQPDQVMWSPRPDVPQGGVYVVPDELGAAYSSAGTPTKRGKKAATTATTADAGTTPATTGTTTADAGTTPADADTGTAA